MVQLVIVVVADFDECASLPCRNGASCFDMVNKYRCKCEVGYVGDNCSVGERTVNAVSTPCQCRVNTVSIPRQCHVNWIPLDCHQEGSRGFRKRGCIRREVVKY